MKHQYTKNLAALIFGTLIGLIGVESIARVIYTQPWHVSLLEAQTAPQVSARYNSLNLRDQDYSVQKPPNTKRVLILGDSFTYGSGVPDDEAVFPELLEYDLNQEYAEQGTKIEILNGGIPGSHTGDWVELLTTVQDSYTDIDVILIVFFLRDGTQTTSIGGFFGPIRDELEENNRNSFLYQYSYFFRLYQDTRDKAYLSKKYSQALNESYLGNHKQTEEWEIAKSNILKIKEIGESIDAEVGLVIFPVLVELNANYPFKEICDVIGEFSSENGIPTHSLLPDFMGENGPDLWVSSYNQHPNEKGHEIAANSMLPFLKELLEDSSQ